MSDKPEQRMLVFENCKACLTKTTVKAECPMLNAPKEDYDKYWLNGFHPNCPLERTNSLIDVEQAVGEMKQAAFNHCTCIPGSGAKDCPVCALEREATAILQRLHPQPSIDVDPGLDSVKGVVDEMCPEICEIPRERWQFDSGDENGEAKPPCFFVYEHDTGGLFKGCRKCREWITPLLTNLTKPAEPTFPEKVHEILHPEESAKPADTVKVLDDMWVHFGMMRQEYRDETGRLILADFVALHDARVVIDKAIKTAKGEK